MTILIYDIYFNRIYLVITNSTMQIREFITEFTIPSAQHIIIDTDAGCDDCQAIILAISEAKITGKTIIGITCSQGNATI